MPRTTVKVHGTYESITRPIAMGVTRDVMAVMGIDTAAADTILLGEFGVREQAGAKMGEPGQVSFGSSSKITATLEDNVRYDNILSTHVRSKEHPPIYADRRLGIGIYPVYLDSELTITFRYQAANKEEAQKWRDDFLIKKAEELSVLYHEISYNIPMQDGIFQLLYHLWELRERQAGYGDTFEEYLKSIQQREITTLTRVDGDIGSASIAVPERQIQVTGWFDFTEPPKPEKIDGETRWLAEWSYKCLYKRCSHFYIVYPMAVHQQHISSKYFSKKRYYSYEAMPKISGVRVIADEMIKSSQRSGSLEYVGGLRFPQWDDWIPRPGVDGSNGKYKHMFNWLIGLSPTDPTKLLDLKATPEFRWSLHTERHMRTHHRNLTRRKKSIIYIRLYKGDVPIDDDLIYVDEDLVLRSYAPLDLRQLYHVRYSLVMTPRLLETPAIDDMRHDPEFTYEVLKTMSERLEDQRFLDSIVSDTVIRRGYVEEVLYEAERRTPTGPMSSEGNYTTAPKDKKDWYQAPDGSYLPEVKDQGYWSKSRGLKTVQSLLIVSMREDKK